MKCPKCHFDNPSDSKFCKECGTQLLPSEEISAPTKTLDLPIQGLAQGSVFADRYEIVEQLGEGGMGQVYRARDTQIKEDIAIKVLRPEIALDKKILERFRNELRFARKITHKSVCRMHDISVSGGTTYITMEYVEGEDLKSVIQRKGKLGIGQALGVVMQIADGLIEAHNLGIVHRDLKPQNIMIDPDGNAKIMDFGIARSTQAEGVTQEGTIIGTPEYMSPEQVEGRAVDQRSDIYSLAVILYEMLTGRVPFSGETVLDIALKHKSQEPENPQKLNKKIPDAIANLILHSMAKDPRERYQSAEELLKSLLSIEESLPESERSAMRIVPRLPGAKAVRSNLKKVLVPTAAVAAIVVLALITWRLLFPPQQIDVLEGRPTLAVLYFKNNTGDSSYDEWRKILPDMLISDLMQSKYLSVVSQDQIYSFLGTKGLLEARNYSVEDLKELVKEVRANYLVQGFLTKSGENFTLSVTLQDAKNLNSVGAVDIFGRGTDSFPSMVDDLSPKIKPYLGLTTEDIAKDFDENIADVTSPVPAAYDFYIRARRAKIEYRQKEAIELLDKAVAVDPDFATAFRLKAEIHGTGELWNIEGEYQRRKEAAKQAFEAIQRRKVTERERLFIEAYNYHMVESNWGKSTEKLEELLTIYPDDYDANHNLGIIFEHGENYERAAKHYEVASKSSLATIFDFQVPGYIYALNQQYEKAREIFRLGLEKFPDTWNLRCEIAHSYCLEGQYERALAECENMYLADPLTAENCRMRGQTLYFMEDFQAAEDEFKKLLKREKVEDRTTGRSLLINLYKLQGRFNDIFEQVELSREDPNSQLVYNLIDIYASQGNFEAAEKALEEWTPGHWKVAIFWKPYTTGITRAKMKRWDEAMKVLDGLYEYMRKSNWTTNKLLNRLIADLQGRVELEKENYGLAIEYLEQAKELIPGFNYDVHAWHVEALARAYYKSGNLERAREEYELITTLRGGRYGDGDIYAKSFYMLGKIAEEFGEKKEARKQYTRFLELWKNADPGLPEVADARQRLSKLQVS